jgi:putative ABC transport system permease protein
MTFVMRMLARELRSSWQRLLFFFVCVAIGVGAIVALRSVIQSVRAGLMSEARSIIASDVLISTNRPWTNAVLQPLEERLRGDDVLERIDAIETATMVRAEGGADAARMVELRGVQPAFPFYGRVVLQDGTPYSHALLRGRGALVRPELLTQLGTSVGGRLIIGGQPFTIRGVIAQEPGRRVGAFSFGSRVLIDYDDLRATELLAFGSRASYQILLRVRETDVERLTREIRRDFRDRFVQARSYRSTEDDIGEDLLRAENYLSLVGFIMVVLGGIGVWSVTRVFVKQKIKSVAILKCVGATAGQILATYVAQVVLLGLTGSLLGVAIAAVAIAAIPESAAAAFGNVSYGLTFSASLQGVAVGLLVSLLFSLVPLLEVRRVKPLLLLRSLDTQGAPAGLVTRKRRFPAALVPASVSRADPVQIGAALFVSAADLPASAWSFTVWGRSWSVPPARWPPLRTFRCATRSSACVGRGTRRG